MKCLCLQALAIVYGRCHEEIGPFTDTRYIIGMLERVRMLLKETDYMIMSVECMLNFQS